MKHSLLVKTGAPLLLLAALLPMSGRLQEQSLLLPGTKLGNSEVVGIAGEQAFPRAIIDPAGRTILLQHPPRRIVSGILAGDELLARIAEPGTVASVTYLADDAGISNAANVYPDSIPRNYGTIEEYIALEADLVIVAAYSNATTVEMLLSTGIPVIRFADFHSYADIRRNLITLSRAIGQEQRALAWINEMDARIKVVQQIRICRACRDISHC